MNEMKGLHKFELKRTNELSGISLETLNTILRKYDTKYQIQSLQAQQQYLNT